MKKVIIWGHKLHTHTHSYIHSSYYKAFKRLGYDTYWFDDSDNVNEFDFENSIFLTEGQVDKKIPMVKSSFYILHHCDNMKYDGYKFINLCNYVNDCRLGKSFNYTGSNVEKINYWSYYDDQNKALYQPWATDIFPDQFGDVLTHNDNINEVYYIGSIWSENIDLIRPFAQACFDNKKIFTNKRFISDEEGRDLVKSSFISPDIRCLHHVNVGYIPCRIFKNISYGVMPATNSPFVRDFFGDDLLPFSENTYDLFDINKNFYLTSEYHSIVDHLMNEVKNNHTYLNRVNTIVSFI